MNWEVPIMRSKKLSSESTILKKDLTRFAPVWLGLCAYLFIWGATILTKEQGHGDFYEPIAPIFAPILAIVVFGYLCDPRECHMVHSLPLRRERLFAIHVLSASVMFSIPTALFCAVTRNFAVQGAMYRFLFMNLEFLFLFSIGVFCMMLTGRKLGAALLYLFIQCLSFIAEAIIEYLYLPVLPGISLDSKYVFLSPTLIVGNYADFIHETDISSDAWMFIGVIGALSLAILALSMLLYRRRSLEHAGDLLAVGCLDPFFAVCSGLTGAAAMAFFGYDSEALLLLLGCAIGWFAYWMLSKKTGRVFTPGILGGLACLIGVLIGSVYLVHLDPLDRVYYVPEPEKVASVSLGSDYEDFTTQDPALIDEIGVLHLQLAEHYVPSELTQYDPGAARRVHITYELKNGRRIEREYECSDRLLLDRAAWYISQPSALFQQEEPDFSSIEVRYCGEIVYLDPRLLPELETVILADCREGNMYDFDHSISGWGLTVEVRDPLWFTYLSIPTKAANTIAWLEDHCVPIP